MENNEKAILEKLKARDKEALEQIVRLHTTKLFHACLGLGFTESEAEDIVQSVWITFFDVIARFEGRSSVSTFLFGILYNKASEFRKLSSRANPTENIEEVLDSHFDEHGHWILTHSPIPPDKFLESSQNMNMILKCLELLPLNQRMAFMLKEIDEEDSEEICGLLKITISNLGVLLFRARNQLRECIERKSR